jgi:hypothetical protein
MDFKNENMVLLPDSIFVRILNRLDLKTLAFISRTSRELASQIERCGGILGVYYLSGQDEGVFQSRCLPDLVARRLKILKQLDSGQVRLRRYQIVHCIRLVEILQTTFGYLDTSKMGRGKTYIALAVAMYFRLPMLVVCPNAAESVWQDAKKMSGSLIIDIVSIERLRSKRGCQPKHGYLTRIDSGKNKTAFEVTPKFTDLVERGIMVVIDESQFVRNNNAQYKATRALINHIVFTGGRSRFALLTGSPLTESHQIINLLRMIGYIRSRKLYVRDPNSGNLILKGLQEVIDICDRFDSETTARVLESVGYYPRHIKSLVHELYVQVINRFISSAAPAPPMTIETDMKNGFYTLEPHLHAEFMNSIRDLEVATRYREEKESITRDKVSTIRGRVTPIRRRSEFLKASIFDRLAKEELERHPHTKVIIGVHFIDTLDALEHSLRDYHPLILRGSTDKKSERGRRIRLFQNDPHARLLLCIIKVGSISISLHDREGKYPRVLLLSPGYDLLELYQATHRVIRDGTKSDVKVRMIYVKGGELEANILRALSRKSGDLKSVLIRNDDVILPDDYETIFEADPIPTPIPVS